MTLRCPCCRREFIGSSLDAVLNVLIDHWESRGIGPDDAPLDAVLRQVRHRRPQAPSAATVAGYGNRRTRLQARRAKREYADTVLSSLIKEPVGPNSFPVPWTWTGCYRWAPSELSYVGGMSDDDFDDWFGSSRERWAHSVAPRRPWISGVGYLRKSEIVQTAFERHAERR